jgi:transcriptional regulator of acetoin/glycerol metabolism
LPDDFLEDVRRHRAAMPTPAECIAPPQIETRAEPVASCPAIAPVAAEALVRTLGMAEIEMIREALAAAKGNISDASRRLGISRNTIYRKLRWSKVS